MKTSFTPKHRYTTVAIFSEDLERVVLIHKLRPAWQAGKANFPGGKVDEKDWPTPYSKAVGHPLGSSNVAYRHCAVRKVAEGSGGKPISSRR